MHITRPSRLVPFPPAQAPSWRMAAIATILLGGALLASQHGISFLPCGEDPSATCE